jgi:hypothetical protein
VRAVTHASARGVPSTAFQQSLTKLGQERNRRLEQADLVAQQGGPEHATLVRRGLGGHVPVPLMRCAIEKKRVKRDFFHH